VSGDESKSVESTGTKILDYIALGFLLAPPGVVADLKMRGENIDVINTTITFIACWAMGGVFVWASHSWRSWRSAVPMAIPYLVAAENNFWVKGVVVAAAMGGALALSSFLSDRSPNSTIVGNALSGREVAPTDVTSRELDNARKSNGAPTTLLNLDPLKQFTWTDASAAETETAVTPAFLMSLYRDRTKIQANAEASLYIGRRIRMQGKVRDVANPGNGTVMVFLETTDGTQISMVFLGEEGKIVSIYAIDQSIDSMCIIREISASSLLLYPCKLDDLQR
jgi:hypothetical protein